jgi:hypothetical protein
MEPTALPERPEPPSYLSEDESALWRDVVAVKPVDWFMRDSQPILVAYCQSAIMHRGLCKRWRDADPAAPYDAKLIELINATSNRMSMLAVKLRLTNQSRFTPGAASTATKKATPLRPWETAKTG